MSLFEVNCDELFINDSTCYCPLPDPITNIIYFWFYFFEFVYNNKLPKCLLYYFVYYHINEYKNTKCDDWWYVPFKCIKIWFDPISNSIGDNYLFHNILFISNWFIFRSMILVNTQFEEASMALDSTFPFDFYAKTMWQWGKTSSYKQDQYVFKWKDIKYCCLS